MDSTYGSALLKSQNTNTVILNNPWGENKGRSKKENARLAGEFTLTLEEFKKHFSYVTVSDTPALICK